LQVQAKTHNIQTEPAEAEPDLHYKGRIRTGAKEGEEAKTEPEKERGSCFLSLIFEYSNLDLDFCVLFFEKLRPDSLSTRKRICQNVKSLWIGSILSLVWRRRRKFAATAPSFMCFIGKDESFSGSLSLGNNLERGCFCFMCVFPWKFTFILFSV